MVKVKSPKPWNFPSNDTKRPIEGGKRGKGGKSQKAEVARPNRNPSGDQHEMGTSGRGKGPHRDNRSGSARAWDRFVPDISAHPARRGRNAQGSKEKPKLTNSEPKVRSFRGANAGPGGKTRYRPGGGNR
jgi:hypothetical protein